MTRDAMSSDENSPTFPKTWSRRVEGERSVFVCLGEEHLVIASGYGVSVELYGLTLSTPKHFESFRWLLLYAWDEAKDFATESKSQVATARAGGAPLEVEIVGRALVLRTPGTTWGRSRDLLKAISELRQWRQRCWPM
ncbi:hypothetical protein LVJ94_35150 [Pendulispora rubella]|uniref:Uncharacterized protein n=1 Tax=Pendulispora rubella TaxID=2741070 RepID=A0ABZ2KVN0_9BACT